MPSSPEAAALQQTTRVQPGGATSSFLLQKVPLRPVGGVYRSGAAGAMQGVQAPRQHLQVQPQQPPQRRTVNSNYAHTPHFAEVEEQRATHANPHDPLSAIFPWRERKVVEPAAPRERISNTSPPRYAARARGVNQVQTDRISSRLAQSLDAYSQHPSRTTARHPPLPPHPEEQYDQHHNAVRIGQGAVYDTRGNLPGSPQNNVLDVADVATMLRQANVLRPFTPRGGGPIEVLPVDLSPDENAHNPVEPIEQRTERKPTNFIVQQKVSDRHPDTQPGYKHTWPPARDMQPVGRFGVAPALPGADHHHLVKPVVKYITLRDGSFDIKYTATNQGIFIDGLVPGGAAERAGVPSQGRIAKLNGLNIHNMTDLSAAKELSARHSRAGKPMQHEVVVDVGVERPTLAPDPTPNSLDHEIGRMVTAISSGERLINLVRAHPSLTCESEAEVASYFKVAGQQGLITDADSTDRTVFVEFVGVDLQAWLPLTVVEEHKNTATSLKIPFSSPDEIPRDQTLRRPSPDPPKVTKVKHNYRSVSPEHAHSDLEHTTFFTPRERIGLRDPDELANLPLVDPMEEIDAIPAPQENLRNMLSQGSHRDRALTPAPTYRNNYSPERMAVETMELVDTLRLVPYTGMESPSPSPEASPMSNYYVEGDERALPEQLALDGEEFVGEDEKTFPQYGFDAKADGVYLKDYGFNADERGNATRETTLFPPPFYDRDEDSASASSRDSHEYRNDAYSSPHDGEDSDDYKERLDKFQEEMVSYHARVPAKTYRNFVSEMVYQDQCPPELRGYYRNQLDRMERGKPPFKDKKVSIKEDNGSDHSDKPDESPVVETPKKKKKKKKKGGDDAKNNSDDPGGADLKPPEDDAPPPSPGGKKKRPRKRADAAAVPPPPTEAETEKSEEESPKSKPKKKKKKKEAEKEEEQDDDSPSPDEATPKKAKPKKKKPATQKDAEEQEFLSKLKVFDDQMESYYKSEGKDVYTKHLQNLKDSGAIPIERQKMYDTQLKDLAAGKEASFQEKKKKKKKPA